MELPVAIFLLPYLIFLVVFLVMSAANIYHVVHFGSFDTKNTTVVAAYLLFSIGILLLSMLYFFTVDWGQTLGIGIPQVTIEGFPQ